VIYQHAELGSRAGPKSAPAAAEGHVLRLGRRGFAVEWCEFAPPAIRALIRIARARNTAPASDWRDAEVVDVRDQHLK
jgi:hypothetical protein